MYWRYWTFKREIRDYSFMNLLTKRKCGSTNRMLRETIMNIHSKFMMDIMIAFLTESYSLQQEN